MTAVTLLLTALEGLLAFVSPCILPMLPIYLAWLARGRAADGGSGGTLGAAGARNRFGGCRFASKRVISSQLRKTKKRESAALLARTLCFILGFTIVFVLLGLSVTALGRLLAAHRTLLTRIGGGFIALFGLSFILDINVPLLSRTVRLPIMPKAGGALSAVLFGVVFSLGWTPCLGAYLSAALALAGRADTLLKGAALLLAFSLGLGVPYFLVALLADRLKPVTAFLMRRQRVISVLSGAVLLILGLSMLTGLFGYYAALFDVWQ